MAYSHQSPRWLTFLEKRLGFLAIPRIAVLFVTLQALGFLFVTSNPAWFQNLALFPSAVFEGEVWRLITFLSLPLSLSPLWVLLVLWFLYFIINMIETQWGEFKTTFYILISILLMIGFSLAFDYPITQISHFQSTLFLAAASLFPENQILLFLVIPVKMKWLAWLTGAFVLLEFIQGGTLDRLFLLAIYFNYFLFFGPAFLNRIRQYLRRKNFERKMRS